MLMHRRVDRAGAPEVGEGEPRPRLRVLVAAYACSPNRGSEPGVGWGWVRMMAPRHDLFVITSAVHEQEIREFLAREPGPMRSVRFYFVRWDRLMTLERLFPPAHLFFYRRRWQRDAFRLAVGLHERWRFDLVHQLTYVGFRVPGEFWRIDAPLVWGPIGGLENTTWRLLPATGFRGLVHFTCRNFLNSLQKRALPGPKRAFRKARGGILAATPGIRREIAQGYGEDSQVVCEVGVDPFGRARPTEREDGAPLRISWSGLHEPWKALPLLLRALAELGSSLEWSLDVLGSGPLTSRWRRLSRGLGIDGRCRWHGWLSRDAALEVMRRAHMHAITSVHDLTSTITIEALACGLPVVCPDHCGFAAAVTEECGIRLPIRTLGEFRMGLVRAIRELAGDESWRRRLSRGAIQRAREFTWERKAELVDRVYRKVAANGNAASGLRAEIPPG